MSSELSQYFRENFYTIVLIWIVLSLIFSAAVLFVGIKRGKRNLGVIGAIVSLIVGILSPFLGLISAAVFVTIILIKTSKDRQENLPDANKS